MLLPYTTLTYHGPAAAAMVGADAVGEIGRAVPHQRMRAGVIGTGLGDSPFLRPYRGRNAAVIADGVGSVVAAPKKRTRAALVVKVSDLSQDDVTGAVLEAPVEGGLSLKQALRLLLAYAAGNANGLDGGAVEFKSLDGTKTRIAGTVVAGTRAVSGRDAT